MSQEQEDDFRVMFIEDSASFDDPTIHLQNLQMGMPVMVERTSDNYSEDLIKKLQSLEIGNKIHAKLSSVDYIGEEGAASDGLWFFDDIEVLTRTRITFIDDPVTFPKAFSDLCDKVDASKKGLLKQNISSNGERVGVATAFPVSHAPNAWSEIRDGFRLFEPSIESTLGSDAEPPFEIIFMRVNEGKHIITLHFDELDTKIAQAIR